MATEKRKPEEAIRMETEKLLNGREVSLTEVLDARERRAARQKEMLKGGGETLVSYTLNMPGPVKQFPLARAFFERGLRRLERSFARAGISVSATESFFEPTGNEAFLMADAPAPEVKKITCALEESSPASRLYDMDVLDRGGVKVERSAIGWPPRRCIVCGRPVAECAPRRAHDAFELARTAALLMYEDECARLSSRVARTAQRALLYEVCVSPKPGLIDRFNNGSHADMDLFTFIDSACALGDYFALCARMGADYENRAPEELFRALRLPGMEAEETMRAATNGVNAHKGAIFSLGVLCAARGLLWARGVPAPPRAVTRAAAEIVSGVTRELTPSGKTAGQRIFQATGVTGVRGEAAAGFPSVVNIGLPAFEEALASGETVNDAAIVSLLRLIRAVDDTNMIKRSSLSRFREIQKEIGELIDREPFPSDGVLLRLDKAFIDENLSPGGCADLLAITLFLHFLRACESETASWSAPRDE